MEVAPNPNLVQFQKVQDGQDSSKDMINLSTLLPPNFQSDHGLHFS